MVRKLRCYGLAIAAAALLTPAVAAAQAPPNERPRLVPKKELSRPEDCVRTRATTGEGLDVRGPEGRALSRQLAQANGVICPPPQVDPDMKKPALDGGTMPVIRPPGRDTDHGGTEPE